MIKELQTPHPESCRQALSAITGVFEGSNGRRDKRQCELQNKITALLPLKTEKGIMSSGPCF